MKIGLSIILLLNCIEVAFLGTQLRKANSTEHSELRNCSLAGHTRQANCTRSRKLLHCTRGLTNNKWDCSDGGLDWLAMENENSTTRKVIVDYYQLMVRVTCPDPCACAMTHVVSNRAGVIIPMITADCAKKNLETAPESLPPSTTTLRLEGNKLSSIRSIVQNPQYSKLMDLYLDNNKIHAVKELEGSEWFTTFRVLSLRGNLLKQIPVYAFDKAFQVNNNIMNISTMPLGNVCSSNEVKMPISTLNIVNLVLTFIIILVLSKFLYDWHRFRTTGKLPWISSILP
ncbi:unnamed protein product [Leptidea sinapis]|uniref:LRRNT domain-containing protein n=1 Tax=Leptidea sinapis TaxID=189913 RepID=A0A5E4Q158_9NEOP|nr:unnamed protein product [Leptidea sinapis]